MTNTELSRFEIPGDAVRTGKNSFHIGPDAVQPGEMQHRLPRIYWNP